MAHNASVQPLGQTLDRECLTFPNRFLLWALRIWVVAHHQQRSPLAVLERAFRFLGSEEGAPLLNRLMMALGAAARRQVDVRPPCHIEISADERRLLDIVRMAQSAAPDAAGHRFLLLSLIQSHQRHLVEDLVHALGRDLLRVGLDLASSELTTGKPANTPCATARRRLAVGQCPAAAPSAGTEAHANGSEAG